MKEAIKMKNSPYLSAEDRKILFLNKISSMGKFEDLEMVGNFIGTNVKTKFLCKRCNTVFETRPSRLFEFRCCPTCRNSRKNLQLGGELNAIAYTNKEMFDLLLNKKDGYKYTQSSSVTLEWVCPFCKNIIKARASNVYNRGLSCCFCGDGFSYPNKFMANLLTQLNVKFDSEKIFKWSKFSKKSHFQYDFYIPDKNMIIEMMGRQHYPQEIPSFNSSYKEIHDNDIQKENLALNNKIDKYIKIDARLSEFNFIKKSCVNSLKEIFNLENIKWDIVEKNGRGSLLHDCVNEFNENLTATTQDIANKMGICRGTVVKYLLRGSELGLCNYTVDIGSARGTNKSITNKTDCVGVVQCSRDGNFIAKFDSIASAKYNTGINNISRCACGKTKTAGGYIWKYSEK